LFPTQEQETGAPMGVLVAGVRFVQERTGRALRKLV
jgi:hypothetical protein